MARFNEILTGRYNRYLQKLLQMKGGPPSAQLASEISTQIGLFHGAETMYLQGWELFFASFSQANLAAANSGVRLRNPALSGVIAVITKLAEAPTINSSVFLRAGALATDLTAVPTVLGIDP